ncbi:MAG TPA: hypothetical protein VGV15_03075 [Terriglobales bacterium]|nr:hypothetical protein [Terriglobales bacterium]
MNHTAAPMYYRPNDRLLMRQRFLAFLILLIASGTAVSAQDASQPKNSLSSAHATHVLGFAGAQGNANGTLSIEGDALQFQKSGNPAAQVKIRSIQAVVLGEESKQVGGTPMTLGKAAVPFGGGRAVSLFAHKKYETLTLEYVDADGGFHGAIFELNKGQAESFRNELVAKGAQSGDSDGEPTKQTPEAASEKK